MKWYLPEYDEGPADAVDIPKAVYFSGSPEDVARDAAEWAADTFFHYRDGWEASWPKDFVIIDDTGKEWVFTVEIEHNPSFHARIEK